MLFNSYIFIFAFFPIIFFGYFRIGKHNHELASLWLVAASLFFYGWWDVRYLGLLLSSIVFNYGAGYLIWQKIVNQSGRHAKILLLLAIGLNLTLLGYFKYAKFFASNINYFTGTSLNLGEIILPLGISFFTFTQIAFLVDTYQGKVKELNFVHYTLFVTYFPHLIAGPVLHHKEMMPQFSKPNVCHINWDNVAVGLSVFILGLAKKVLIADLLADFSTPIFNAVAAGGQPMFFEAWIAALSYTLQLYFDFSAYSDMAIGISLMFNVRLPMNFNSPYKSTSIIDFWRRWHMTLSRFLRDYLYIPLGGSRNGELQRYLNIIITMLLGGLWHGAGWTFIVWGGLHGLYLIINHAWREVKENVGWGNGGIYRELGAGALTFLAVVVGWVFFRADSLSSAKIILQGMAGLNGVSLPESLQNKMSHYFLESGTLVFSGLHPLVEKFHITEAMFILVLGFTMVWLMPNLSQIFKSYSITCDGLNEFEPRKSPLASLFSSNRLIKNFQWHPSKILAWLMAFIFCISVFQLTHVSEFLYFQF